MSTDDKKENATGRSTFQLRPSMLSGSGFGSPFSSGSVGEKQNKGFMLRPSSLSSAADKLEANKTDTRKRQLSGSEEKELEEGQADEPIKKAKVAEEETKPKTPQEPTLKLTEDITKPTGIGSFGFASRSESESGSENSNGNSSSSSSTKNYFSVKPEDKVGFVFGSQGASSGVGFGAFKKDDVADAASDNDKTLGGGGEKGADEAFSRVASHEKLLENATEYEKTHNHRQHYEEVDKFTGEEGEQHVLQIFCKLHVFNKQRKTWLERGRGTLRLNDKCQTEGCFQSRLVFRTQGTNLVQLNTKLFPEMCCEKVKEKSVRISAVDPETKEVRVYLISTSMKDALQTYTAIERRVTALKRGRENSTPKDNDSHDNSNDSKTINSDIDDDDSNSETEQSNKRLESATTTSTTANKEQTNTS